MLIDVKQSIQSNTVLLLINPKINGTQIANKLIPMHTNRIVFILWHFGNTNIRIVKIPIIGKNTVKIGGPNCATPNTRKSVK